MGINRAEFLRKLFVLPKCQQGRSAAEEERTNNKLEMAGEVQGTKIINEAFR